MRMAAFEVGPEDASAELTIIPAGGSLKNNVDGYYEYSVVEAGAEQFLGLWGSTVYGGYRLSAGELLPDYYWDRTQDEGALLGAELLQRIEKNQAIRVETGA